MLRPLFKADLPQLLAIDQAVQVAPWTEDTFKSCFEAGYQGWLIERDKRVVGFIMLSLRVDECHILNLCVLHAYQRQGYGRQLLEQVLQYAAQQGAGVIYLEVRRSNERAIRLYQAAQFSLVGERQGYYPLPSGTEDALVFAKRLRAN